jgi:ribokinase
MDNRVALIVPGGLNTDIIGAGVGRLARKGELSYGGRLVIGPGGKSRNIAQMAACFLGRGTVAMIGVTVKDPYGLWKVPYDALADAGVVTDYVRVEPFDPEAPRFPGVALIPVDREGNNQIYVLPGINETLSAADIEHGEPLFASPNARVLALTLEIPAETARYAAARANRAGMRILIDPGGIKQAADLDGLLPCGPLLLKPNEHEARIITGISVTNFKTAALAARAMAERGAQNVMITHGRHGAYLFAGDLSVHIRAPRIRAGDARDETGCGDQTAAVMAALLCEGYDLAAAARCAVAAGTLQYHRIGIDPVRREDINELLKEDHHE